MVKSFLRNSIIWLCLTFSAIQLYAQSSAQYVKPNIYSKDIFNTAVFVENKNVVANYTGENILYFSNHDYLNTYFTKTGLIYKMLKMVPSKEDSESKVADPDTKKVMDDDENDLTFITGVVKMEWLGANPNVQIIAGEQSKGYHTFLQSQHGRLKGVAANAYKTLTYKDIYPGIDVVYTFPEKGGIEYTLVVQPGADVSQVRMAYSHDVKSITTDNEGNNVLHTTSGDIIEHAPATVSGSGNTVASSFSLVNNIVSFRFPNGYDKSQKLVIDPWISTLTTLLTDNLGFDVDYDYQGDLLVYGAGPQNDGDTTNNFKVAKYSPAGNVIWTFNGMVPSIGWSTVTDTSSNSGPLPFAILPSNFIADKVTGKVYVGQALAVNGTQIIRLSSTGIYDNFESTADSEFREDWGLIYRCSDASVVAMGGGTNSDVNMAVINTGSGSIAKSNITGVTTGFYTSDQDIVCGVYDSSGSLYVIMNDAYNQLGFPVLPYTNTIYKVNSSFTGNIWSANSNFTTFNEANNDPFWITTFQSGAGGNGNWFNCLAANGQYLFYYDGRRLAAYNLATGAQVGTTTRVSNYTELMQGGIAVDNCNHVYLGGIGMINTYTFNGTNFTADASIPTGNGNFVTDIKYNSSNNLLYITGKGFAATAIAALSTTCVSSSYTVTTTGTCDSAIVHISPSANLNPRIFNIIWTNSAGTVVSQLLNTSDTINVVNGLSSGTYYVTVQWNTNCGGTAISDSAVITCNSSLVHSNDTTICAGHSATLSATGTPAGGTYLWTPGGVTTNTLTVTPAATTIYTVVYTPTTGAPLTANITVTVQNNCGNLQAFGDTTICPGQSTVIAAVGNPAGGSYNWTPGNGNTAAITVTPAATTTYTVIYTPLAGSPDTATVTVTVKSNCGNLQTFGDTTICPGQSTAISALGNPAGGSYSWPPGNGNTATITVTPAATTTYTVIYTPLAGPPDTGTVTVTVKSNCGSIQTFGDTIICPGQSTVISALGNPTGGSYSWTPGNGNTAAITVTPAATTTYTVIYTPLAGPPDTGTVTVTINTQPVTVTVNSVSVCNGGTATLVATPSIPGGTYSWAPGAYTTDSIIVTPATTTTYTVTYSTLCGTADNNGTVTVLPPPTEVLTQVPTTCAQSNGTIRVAASGGTPPYQYAFFGSALQAADSFNNLSAANYTILVQDANGCVDTSSISVGASSGVFTNLTALSPGCVGSAGTIIVNVTSGTAPYTFALNGGASQATDTFTNLAPGKYVITTTDASGCMFTDTGVINPAQPLFLSLEADSENCFGGATSTITATATGGSPGYGYSLNGGIEGSGNQFDHLPVGIYTVVATDANGCTVTASDTIYQPTALVLDSLIATPVICLGQQNGTVSVYVHGGHPGYNYTATQNPAIFVQTTNGILSGLDTGVYTIQVSDSRGCIFTDTVSVPNAIPDSFTTVAQPTSCYGPAYHDGSITITALTPAGSPYTYALDSGAFQVSGQFDSLSAGAWYPEAKNFNGCIFNLASVIVPQPAAATLSVYPTDTTLQLGHSVTLATTFGPYPSSSIVSYLWTPNIGLSCIDCPDPVASPYASQNTYQLAITYNGGCVIDTVVHINVSDYPDIFIPNVFTPNGDGNNDIFYVYGQNIKSLDLKVFNRWGIKVFESKNQFWGWDGTYKGVMQDPNVFVYEVEIFMLDNTVIHKRGSVTLVR